MSTVRCQISISLDGFVAGPNQSPEHPVGEGGMRLHEWLFATEAWNLQHGGTGGNRNIDSNVLAEDMTGVGAHIMGRGMFGGGPGDWDESWLGWWDEEPPFHAPVFVLTHHPREAVRMEGGTTFTFVTEGIESALDLARKAAGEQDVAIAGGASAVQQYIAAGLLDELHLHVVPIVLGSGLRLLENVGDPEMKPVSTVASPSVTHIRYRLAR